MTLTLFKNSVIFQTPTCDLLTAVSKKQLRSGFADYVVKKS